MEGPVTSVRRTFFDTAALLVMTGVGLASLAQTTQNQDAVVPSQVGVNQVSARNHSSPQSSTEGERIFEQNCSRCHKSPDGFSPRISGTILRHMRVRASLSRHDEEELRRYFNP